MAVDLHPVGINRSAYKAVYAPTVTQFVRSPFHVRMRADLDNVFFNLSEFAITCRYRHKGSSVDVSYPCILDTPSDMLSFGVPQPAVTARPVIEIPLHRMAQYPKVGDRVTLDGVLYAVSVPPTDDGVGVVTLELQRASGARQ